MTANLLQPPILKALPQHADDKRRAGGGDPPWGIQSAARPPSWRGAVAGRVGSSPQVCLHPPLLLFLPLIRRPCVLTSIICRYLTPPYPSPAARAFRRAPSKNAGRPLQVELKIRSNFTYVLGAVLNRQNGQHGPNLAPKMEPKTAQNRAKIDAKIHRKNRCLSGPIFDAILVDFGRENGGKLVPKSKKNRC